MQRATGLIGYLYRHNLVRYLFVGGSTFALDLGLLVLLHGKLNIRIGIATTISYWVSISYNFTLNLKWTFSSSEKKKFHKHILSYGILLGFNYLFTLVFVSVGSHFINYAICKVIAVAMQTVWTYPIYKYVVFADKKQISSAD